MKEIKPTKTAGNGVSLNPWVNDKLDIACAIVAFGFVGFVLVIIWYHIIWCNIL